MKLSESQLAVIRKVLTIVGTVLVTKFGLKITESDQVAVIDWIMAGIGVLPIIVSAIMSKKNADKLEAAK